MRGKVQERKPIPKKKKCESTRNRVIQVLVSQSQQLAQFARYELYTRDNPESPVPFDDLYMWSMNTLMEPLAGMVGLD